jgi:Helix-turn-helix
MLELGFSGFIIKRKGWWKTPFFETHICGGIPPLLDMIEQKLRLTQNRPVLEQILKAHKLSYAEFAKKMRISPRVLRNYRRGDIEFKLNMDQIKTLICLLKPFDIELDELPNDWILEGESRVNLE